MSTWHEVGGNPTLGQPGRIRSIATHLSELAETASGAEAQLTALKRGELRAVWSGEAADAFSEELESLPQDLRKLHGSLNAASGAVRQWADTLDRLQPQAHDELQRHGRATSELQQANLDLDNERSAIAAEDPLAAVADLFVSNPRLTPFQNRVDDAQAQLHRAQREIEQVREETEAAARRVAAALDEASRLGIQNKGFFEKIFSDIGETLIAILTVLDEFIDLIAPFVSMVLLALSFVNPVFAFAAAGFAALDFALTGTRALLGDESVTVRMLLDDGLDLGLAMFGAGVEYMKLAQASAKAAGTLAQASKVLKIADHSIDAITGIKGFADGFLMMPSTDQRPGSVFDVIFPAHVGDYSVVTGRDPAASIGGSPGQTGVPTSPGRLA